jgi:tRNA (guanine-N7-)-methyltransferase
MASEFPHLAIDIDASVPHDSRRLFPVSVVAVHLEIGFGGGERLIASARASPSIGFIGVEPFLNGMAKAVAAIADQKLRNVRLYDKDASDLLAWLPPASLAEVDLFYPDPWPKKRHHKRRFVNPANLDRIARVLAPGGPFRVVSDIPGYIEWTLLNVQRHTAFTWTAERADDWRKPFRGWIETRYEVKAHGAGRHPVYLTFARI